MKDIISLTVFLFFQDLKFLEPEAPFLFFVVTIFIIGVVFVVGAFLVVVNIFIVIRIFAFVVNVFIVDVDGIGIGGRRPRSAAAGFRRPS